MALVLIRACARFVLIVYISTLLCFCVSHCQSAQMTVPKRIGAPLVTANAHKKRPRTPKPCATSAVHQMLALVCELGRIRLNEMLRCASIDDKTLVELLKTQGLVSMAVLRLTLLCREVYMRVGPSVGEHTLLCYTMALQRKPLQQSYTKSSIPRRWWHTYDDGMASLLRKMSVVIEDDPMVRPPIDKRELRRQMSYYGDPSACARDQLCARCKDDCAPIPMVVRKWSRMLAEMQRLDKVNRGCCRREGCNNAVRVCKGTHCLLSLCTSNSTLPTFVDYVASIGGDDRNTELRASKMGPTQLCTCFCSSECLRRVRDSIPNALSTRQLHAWRVMKQLPAATCFSTSRVSLNSAASPLCPRGVSNGSVDLHDPVTQITTLLHTALERNCRFKTAGRQTWQSVPLSIVDREALHELYTRCYNIDVGLLHIMQLMHGMQTGWSQLRQVSGVQTAHSCNEALNIAKTCYQRASLGKTSSGKTVTVPLLLTVQMEVPHPYLTSIQRTIQDIDRREHLLYLVS